MHALLAKIAVHPLSLSKILPSPLCAIPRVSFLSINLMFFVDTLYIGADITDYLSITPVSIRVTGPVFIYSTSHWSIYMSPVLTIQVNLIFQPSFFLSLTEHPLLAMRCPFRSCFRQRRICVPTLPSLFRGRVVIINFRIIYPQIPSAIYTHFLYCIGPTIRNTSYQTLDI